MIYACEPRCRLVALTNPVEKKPLVALERELDSERVLLVRVGDVLRRFRANNASLVDLATMPMIGEREERSRWTELNVIGQVVHVLN